MALLPEDLLSDSAFRRRCTPANQAPQEWKSCGNCGEAFCTASCLNCSPKLTSVETERVFRQAVEGVITLLNQKIPEGFSILPTEAEQQAFEPMLSEPLLRAWTVLKYECRLREATAIGDLEELEQVMDEAIGMIRRDTSMLSAAISDASIFRRSVDETVKMFVMRIKELQMFTSGHNGKPAVEAWKSLQERIPRWSSLRTIIQNLAPDLLLIRGASVFEGLATTANAPEAHLSFSLIATMLHAMDAKESGRLRRTIEKVSCADPAFLSQALTTLVWEAKLLMATLCRDVLGMKLILERLEDIWDTDTIYRARFLRDARTAAKDKLRTLVASSLEGATDLPRLYTSIRQCEELKLSEAKVMDAKVRYFDLYLESAMTQAQTIVRWQYEKEGWKDFGLQTCVDLEFAREMGLPADAEGTVDIELMEYRNDDGVFAARRIPPSPVLPVHWDGQCGPVDVTEKTRALMTRLIALSYSAGGRHPSLVKVVKVRNVHLWQQYAFRRCKLREEHADLHICCQTMEQGELVFHDCDESLNEVYLFHGTGAKEAESISAIGFDNKRLTSVHGLSLNFTNSIARALSFPERATAERKVIVARVLLGDPYHNTVGKSCIRKPESRQGNEISPYDSVITPQGTYEDFYVYNSRQTYPEYIMTIRP
eukprot:GEMP01008000.1.p1 GENE.GEMP01008000.1~~GEMP01008000.1.p1  ORF type:complete len:654 (+),score=112.10 GEMP01008000.1:34-1995(+)